MRVYRIEVINYGYITVIINIRKRVKSKILIRRHINKNLKKVFTFLPKISKIKLLREGIYKDICT